MNGSPNTSMVSDNLGSCSERVAPTENSPLVLSFHGEPVPVCTDVEFDICGICVRLSTPSESLLGQNKLNKLGLFTFSP